MLRSNRINDISSATNNPTETMGLKNMYKSPNYSKFILLIIIIIIFIISFIFIVTFTRSSKKLKLKESTDSVIVNTIEKNVNDKKVKSTVPHEKQNKKQLPPLIRQELSATDTNNKEREAKRFDHKRAILSIRSHIDISRDLNYIIYKTVEKSPLRRWPNWNNDVLHLGSVCREFTQIFRLSIIRNEAVSSMVFTDFTKFVQLIYITLLKYDVNPRHKKIEKNNNRYIRQNSVDYLYVETENELDGIFLKSSIVETFYRMKFKRIPWGNNWYQFSVNIPIMLSYYLLYSSLFENYNFEILNKLSCSLIRSLLETPRNSLGYRRNGANAIYMAGAWIIGSYFENSHIKDGHHEDYKYSIEFAKLEIIEKPNAVGWHRDKSFFFHTILPAWNYLRSLVSELTFHFYGFDNELEDNPMVRWFQAATILKHPVADTTLMGCVMGRTPHFITAPFSAATYGVAVMPMSRVFRLNHKMGQFIARYQIPEIGAYEVDLETFSYGQYWVQYRGFNKIDQFYSIIDYRKHMRAQKNGPLFPGAITHNPLKLLATPSRRATTDIYYVDKDISESFVISFNNIIVAWQRYKLKEFGNYIVYEASWIDGNSELIFNFYWIDNTFSDRTLFFIKDRGFHDDINSVSNLISPESEMIMLDLENTIPENAIDDKLNTKFSDTDRVYVRGNVGKTIIQNEFKLSLDDMPFANDTVTSEERRFRYNELAQMLLENRITIIKSDESKFVSLVYDLSNTRKSFQIDNEFLIDGFRTEIDCSNSIDNEETNLSKVIAKEYLKSEYIDSKKAVFKYVEKMPSDSIIDKYNTFYEKFMMLVKLRSLNNELPNDHKFIEFELSNGKDDKLFLHYVPKEYVVIYEKVNQQQLSQVIKIPKIIQFLDTEKYNLEIKRTTVKLFDDFWNVVWDDTLNQYVILPKMF